MDRDLDFDPDVAPTDEEQAAEERRWRRTKLLTLLVVCLALAILGLWYALFGFPNDKDSAAQESAATAYLEDVARETKGVISPDTSDYGPIGTHVNGGINVTLVVGDCPDVEGYIESPARPKSKADLGELHIVVPGSNRYAANAYPVIHWKAADWQRPLMRGDSTLRRCLPDNG